MVCNTVDAGRAAADDKVVSSEETSTQQHTPGAPKQRETVCSLAMETSKKSNVTDQKMNTVENSGIFEVEALHSQEEDTNPRQRAAASRGESAVSSLETTSHAIPKEGPETSDMKRSKDYFGLPPRPSVVQRGGSGGSINSATSVLKAHLPDDLQETVRRGNLSGAAFGSHASEQYNRPRPRTRLNDRPSRQHKRGVSWDVNVKDTNNIMHQQAPHSPQEKRELPTMVEVQAEQEEHLLSLQETLRRGSRRNFPTTPVLRDESKIEELSSSPGSRSTLSAQHRRFISWDKSFRGSEGTFDGPFSVSTAPSIETGSTHSNTTGKSSKHGNKRRGIELEDVLQQHPLEAEAETLVLAAIEDLDPAMAEDPQHSTLGSTILSNVPVGSENAFNPTPPPLAAPTRDVETLSRRSSSRREGLPTASNGDRRRNHRRQQTMEQRLDGLTDVLEAIHGGNETEDQPLLSEIMAASIAESPTKGAAAAMDKHANALFQRRKRTEDAAEIQLATVYAAGQSETNAATSADSVDSGVANDIEEGEGSDNGDSRQSLYRSALLRKKKVESRCGRVVHKIPLIREFLAFSSAQKGAVRNYVRVLFWIMLPATGISLTLFYLAGNPPTGRIDLEASQKNGTLINHLGNPVDPQETSASWWILFMCIRQIVAVSLAQATQFFVIDFLCVGRQWTAKYLSPIATLLMVQSRGWPFLLVGWSVNNFLMNYGDNEFAAHWLFWQDKIGLFNMENPSGGVTAQDTNFRLLIIALCVGFVVSVKRTWMGFFLGRKTYVNYAANLAKVMKKIILFSKVAALAKDIESNYVLETDETLRYSRRAAALGVMEKVAPFLQPGHSHGHSFDDDDDDASSSLGNSAAPQTAYVIDPEERDTLTGALTDAQRSKIAKLLGAWEEPEKTMGVEEDVSVSAILKFRQSLTFLDTPFTFSYAFGLADTRENCIESAQEVYMRLLLDTPDSEILNFNILATLALRRNGTFQPNVLKDLISLLRPDRNGDLALLDFVKSVDTVYKKARLLRASVKNSQKIDRAFELIINTIFYVIMACVILSQLGFDPFALFLSLSSIILAFAFMIGSASAKYFEGLLLILVQRPYDIGDRVNIEPQNVPGNPNGSASWIVKDVTLFTTTIVLASTNEKATVSNGSLASCRIINGARSPTGLQYVYLKFGTEVPYEKVQIFREALTQFVKARPREWISLLSFRSTDIQADQGFIQYMVMLQHRQSWQEYTSLKTSLAQVQSFCLELSKNLDMRYKSPPLPVNLSLDSFRPTEPDPEKGPVATTSNKNSEFTANSEDLQKVAALFEKR